MAVKNFGVFGELHAIRQSFFCHFLHHHMREARCTRNRYRSISKLSRRISVPNPHGPLSSKVLPRAIEAANDTVSEIIKLSGSSSENMSNTARGPYTKLTPAQRLMIGKRASEHDMMATVNHAPRYTTLHRTTSIAITWSSAQ